LPRERPRPHGAAQHDRAPRHGHDDPDALGAIDADRADLEQRPHPQRDRRAQLRLSEGADHEPAVSLPPEGERKAALAGGGGAGKIATAAVSEDHGDAGKAGALGASEPAADRGGHT
jgi:hypothetical protein